MGCAGRRSPNLGDADPAADDLQPKPVGNGLHLGQQGAQQIGLAGLARPRAVAEHRKVLGIGELVTTQQIETLAVADELEQLQAAHPRRRGEQVGAVLGKRGVARIADAVEHGQGLVAGRTGYPAEAQIVDKRRPVRLLDRDGAKTEDLRGAMPRVGDVAHLVLVAGVPFHVARLVGQQLRARSTRNLLSERRVLAHGLLGFAHQSSGGDVQHGRIVVGRRSDYERRTIARR
jgi:hypothetical protein